MNIVRPAVILVVLLAGACFSQSPVEGEYPRVLLRTAEGDVIVVMDASVRYEAPPELHLRGFDGGVLTGQDNEEQIPLDQIVAMVIDGEGDDKQWAILTADLRFLAGSLGELRIEGTVGGDDPVRGSFILVHLSPTYENARDYVGIMIPSNVQ